MPNDKLETAHDEGNHQLSSSPNIISREQAAALGLKHYFTSEPCKHGHIAENRQVESLKPGTRPRNQVQAPCCEPGKGEGKGSGSRP